MIKSILNKKFAVVHFPLFSKYVNTKFDIIVQNNRSIIVVDKVLKRLYKDLKTAYVSVSTIPNFKKSS